MNDSRKSCGSHVARVCACLLSIMQFILTGCFTVAEEKYRTSERRYPSDCVIKEFSVETVEAKKNETIRVNALTEKQWRVDNLSTCYDELTQYRGYATINEPGYRLDGDLFETVFYLLTMGPFITPFVLPLTFFDGDRPRPFLCHYTIAALPGICTTTDYPKEKENDGARSGSEMEELFNGKCPVYKRTVKDKETRVTDTRTESERCVLPFTVEIFDAQKKLITSKKLSSGGALSIPLCDTILSNPDDSFVVVRVQPESSAKLGGPQEKIVKYDLAPIIERKLAADPDPSSYVPARFALSAPKLASRRKDGRLDAGAEGSLAIPVANTGTGDGYKISVDVLDATGDVRVSKSAETLILRAGKDCLVNVPFTIPLQAQDGSSTVRLVARDALGRQSPPLTLEIPYARRAMPKLMLTGAKLIRSSDAADEYTVEADIRNKGDGYAEKVGLSCDSESASISLVQTNGLDEDIAPREWRTVRMAARIPNVTAGQVLKIKLNASERLGVGGAADEFEVVVPE